MPSEEERAQESQVKVLKNFQQDKYKDKSILDHNESELFNQKYTLSTTKVGNGSQGDVFEIFLTNDLEQKKPQVIKKFKYDDIFKRHMHLVYFLEMIEILRNHPNDQLVLITDRLQFMDDYLQMIMEKIGDYNIFEFKKHFKATCTSQRTSKYIFEQIILVIKQLQDLGLIHRDIKSRNFVVASYDHFVNRKGDVAAYTNQNGCLDAKVQIKLVDFDFMDYFKINKHNTYIGTRPQVSPQNYLRNDQTEKADLQSAGMVWQFILAGGQPVDKDKLDSEQESKSVFEEALNRNLQENVEEPWTKSMIQCLLRQSEDERCDLNKVISNKSFDLESHVITKREHQDD